MKFHFVRMSSNRKTGPIPVVGSESSTCPPECPFRHDNEGGCYAKMGLTNISWRSLDQGKEGPSFMDLKGLVQSIKSLPVGQLWRYAVFGDLPGNGSEVDSQAVRKIVSANNRRKGFGYTHKPLTENNLKIIREANKKGFTINLSANSLAHADRLKKTGLPVVTVLPADQKSNCLTPEGHKVVVCPATKSDRMTCANCGLCQMKNRGVIVGFPAHGVAKKRVEKVFNQA